MRGVYAGVDPGAGRSPWGVAALGPEGEPLLEALAPGAIEAAQLLARAARGRPLLVAVDAPLRLAPRGLRPVEEALRRCTGVPLLPHGLPAMRRLHHAAREMLHHLQWLAPRVEAVETYPAAAARILGIRRPRGRRRHLVDAKLAAAAAWCLHAQCGLALEWGRDAIALPTGLLPPGIMAWIAPGTREPV